MREAPLDQLKTNMDHAADSLKHWRSRNAENSFWHHEAARHERLMAEDSLVEAYYALGIEHAHKYKIQLTAGEKAVHLFVFSSNAYDFLTVDRHFGDDYDLLPGDSLDLVQMHENVGNDLYHGRVLALYMGHTLFAHSVGIAETLSLGGSLAIVPAEAEETYKLERH